MMLLASKHREFRRKCWAARKNYPVLQSVLVAMGPHFSGLGRDVADFLGRGLRRKPILQMDPAFSVRKRRPSNHLTIAARRNTNQSILRAQACLLFRRSSQC